jgi:prolyl oligopeptidase
MQSIPARRADIVDDFHGTLVADPYRWLEDPAAEETLAFVAAHNAATRAFLDATGLHQRLVQRLTELWDYPRYSAPRRRGDLVVFSKNDGLQNQAIVYAQNGLDGTPRILLDPNTLSADGTAALTSQSLSDDGALLAYGVSQSGSDWQELRVRRVADGTDLPDVLPFVKFVTAAWRHDGAGFFYARYPDPATVPPEEQSYHNSVYWHALGTDQADDPLIYARPDARELGFNPEVTDDGTYLILTVWHGTDAENRVYYRPVAGEGDVIRLIDDPDAAYTFIGNDGPIFFFHTTLDAPRGRIIAIDTSQPERKHWREIVPQGADPIISVALIAGQFVVAALHDAHYVVNRFALDGTHLGDIPLPGLGALVDLVGRPHDTDCFISFTSFLQPATNYRYDFATGALTPWHAPELAFDPEQFETVQVFYPSKDGTRIPMFLTMKKSLPRDGQNPTILYGYGGFNIPQAPVFAPARIAWLEMGGIFAVAGLRGGSEYGEEWHQAGMLDRKQNVFDDFIAAAEWLIAEKWSSTPQLAIEGGSNGGLLVAACMVQRPDLFGAVICRVPVIDMLRYHRFTVGRFWTGEYGNAETNPEHFRFMYAYSPLHNVRQGASYPPTLILSADTDDRVVPAHAKKFAATLHWANAGTHPILLRVETKAGHGLGKPTAKLIDEQADIYAFLMAVLGM